MVSSKYEITNNKTFWFVLIKENLIQSEVDTIEEIS